jgi:hypothetical protein
MKQEIYFSGQDFVHQKGQNQNKFPAVSPNGAEQRNGKSKIAVMGNGFMIEIETEWEVGGDGSFWCQCLGSRSGSVIQWFRKK